MENALLIGLSRQMTLRHKMDVLANNMANVNTAGYKRDTLQFEEYLMPVAEMSDVKGKDARLSFVTDPSVYRSFEQGAFQQSGNELDLAISGDAWFVMQSPDGERYTRNGQLQLNADGELVGPSGLPILGTGGPITIGPDETGIEIAKDGTISTDQGTRGQIRLVSFENNNAMTKQGAMLFASPEAPQDAEDATIHQGFVEKSNVKPVIEFTRIVETVRAYTTVSQALQQTQDLRRDAIERLGGASGT
jgi:flagellar basal-body rod protein FlgF